ncbi:MAG: discoidin domain-containing protein [Planctomycetota bacterium]
MGLHTSFALGRNPEAVDVSAAVAREVELDWIEQDAIFTEKQITDEASSRDNQHGVTTSEDAAGGCDGVKNGRWGFHTASQEQDPWWQVDLQQSHRLDRVVIYNRVDRNKAARTRHVRVLVANAEGVEEEDFECVYEHDGEPFLGVETDQPLVVDLADEDVTARVVRLRIPGRCSFALDEVEVYAADDPETNIAINKPADQKSVSQYSYPGTLPDGVDTADPPRANQTRFSIAHTTDVVRRAKELEKRLRCEANARELDSYRRRLEEFEHRLEELVSHTPLSLEKRRELYFEARRIKRAIAFRNPLLDMDKLLFIKRHDAAGVFHMCDQYYGCNAVPGGGLFVLSNPFGPHPTLRNVLKDRTVENGRLQGEALEGGSFLSPELSFDGRTILFAYTQARAWNKYQGKEAYEWTPECVYHIFKCNVDGSGLVQLTEGSWDDFDPCFLPNGRIAFISMRRGGYLRCGRHCPVYAMHSMEPDGSDIIKLSFHETHEWHPSVTNDGMIVYTRWDYVDRDTNVAHHIWTCYPDGRDPRSFHGNYPERRDSRPWMEMSIRAIPNSPKFVCSTGAHHGHAFGSLALIDPRIEDDDAMSQLERLTPEVPFPEAEGRPTSKYMIYGTPWPLSEEDYLCVYDPKAKNHGIYWIDRHGNKELIYRDPDIPCLDPIPLRPRYKPPIIPDQTLQTAAAREQALEKKPATVSVMNVYDSDFQWPEDAKVAALRVIQVLPKTTAPPNKPRIGVGNQTNARAVLGTVPVQPDGSAYFEVPSGKEIYFQALDEDGLAIQSMRSGTYVHPGERLNCQGCHEPKRRISPELERMPMALGRPPSEIQPDVDGSNPFNYTRLVQPVLDHNCVACHAKENALDLSAAPSGNHGWSRSYQNLAPEFGFYYHVSNGSINTGTHGGSRSIAGEVGARVAPLMDYLDERHYGVNLSDEELYRLTLWLDCNSEFYGSYENTEAQARGEIVQPTLD